MRPLLLVLSLLVSLTAITGCTGLVSTQSTPTSSSLVITNVQTASTTTAAAQIAWTTNVPADSSVDYGTTTSYGYTTPVDSTMVTAHQVTLSGLAAGTTYYYQVNSTDANNNHGKSGGHKFGTVGVSISGTITPTQGGSGAMVTLSGTASASTTADSTGVYSFAGLASGPYGITPSNAGYTFTPASQNVTVGTTNLTGLNFTASTTATGPTITTQPTNQTVTAGQTATFTVVATGAAPLSYQWNKNGAAISGATSSTYTTPATTSSDSGAQFIVTVSNSAGSVTSSPATLSVTSLAISKTGLPSGVVGQAYSAQLNATGGATPYSWSVASGALPAGLALSSSGAISGTPTTAGTSTFTAEVADVNLLTAQQSFTVTIAAATACVGTCYYVSPTGSDSNPGTSAAPFQTIQHAADIVNPGDTVIVEDGTYNGGCTALTQTVTVNRGGSPGNFVTFKSGNKFGAKLDGGNICRDGWVIGSGVSYVRIQDFEITGYAASGGTWADGLQLDCGTCSNIDIVGNKIHDIGKICTDTANGQNGIFMNANSITVEQNSIYNIGRFAAGENGCNPSTTYYQNHDHGIYDYSSNQAKIQSNIFYQNVHGWSIQVYPGSSTNLLIINNTFSDPNPYRQGHIICWGTGTMSGYISNNIFYQPNTAAIWDQYCPGITVNYNLSTNNDQYNQCGSSCASYANDLLNQNPATIMISPDTDFHLILGSPAIGAGTLANAPATDFNGNLRKNPPSIGAYEWGSTP